MCKTFNCIVLFLISIGYIVLGTFEIFIVNNTSSIINDINKQVFIFLIIKIVINYIFGISLFISRLFDCLQVGKEYKGKDYINLSIGCINIMISIWGIILYFGNKDEIYDYLRKMLLVEVIITLCSYGILYLFSCCGCVHSITNETSVVHPDENINYESTIVNINSFEME